MTLEAQIIEFKEKPSLPIGEVGVDAFGEKPYYEDRGDDETRPSSRSVNRIPTSAVCIRRTRRLKSWADPPTIRF